MRNRKITLSFFIYSVLFSVLFINSCATDTDKTKSTDGLLIEKKSIKINILRYEKALFQLDKNNLKQELEKLRPQYRVFLDGDLNNELNLISIRNFINEKRLQALYAKTIEIYPTLTGVEQELSIGFSNFLELYPHAKIPKIYTYVSDLYYEQPVVYGDTVVIIALDMFLGKNCSFYPMVGLPAYKMERCIKESITPDVFNAIARTYVKSDNQDLTLLNKIIQQGKVLYFVDQVLPDVNDNYKIGYTNDQIKWCLNNEGSIWEFIMDQKLLYQTEPSIVYKLYNDAPFTSMLPQESPGKIGIWVGWQIVRSFMEKHDEVSLDSLMRITDSQLIFAKSQYKPKSK